MRLVRRIRPGAPLRGNYDAYALGLMSIVGLESGEDWAGLETYMSSIVRDGVRVGDHEAAGVGSFTLASLEIARGCYREAERWLAEADAQFERQDAFGTVLSIRALRVGIAVLRGDPAGARAALATVHELVGDSEPLPTQIGYLKRAEGWGARALSDAAGAEYFLQAAARVEQPNLRSRLLYEAQRSGPARSPWRPSRRAWRSGAMRGWSPPTPRTLPRWPPVTAPRCSRRPMRWRRSAPTLYAMEAAADAARQFVAAGRAGLGTAGVHARGGAVRPRPGCRDARHRRPRHGGDRTDPP